ncbi:OmpA family protein [Roseomonas hellenica]|uniref:OmpA family protein n=1 Tax=Plastoroseomonas hellenica TaxID=2687306 RepID=A0ABS5F9M3_9PROT|nr:OmpA family protein [Plastoroseomonas hellenica]MBR0669261.1 OmpA family protein [Plastoroseomonas hellenica]
MTITPTPAALVRFRSALLRCTDPGFPLAGGFTPPGVTALRRSALALAALLAAAPAMAQQQQQQQQQQRSFDCVGAGQLEDDVFTIPFARGSATLTEAARSLLAAAVETANGDPPRNLCVLGLTGQEGGATTTIRLAAQRAGTVARALEQRGIAADRVRAEARAANFSRAAREGVPAARAVSIVVLPAAP